MATPISLGAMGAIRKSPSPPPTPPTTENGGGNGGRGGSRGRAATTITSSDTSSSSSPRSKMSPSLKRSINHRRQTLPPENVATSPNGIAPRNTAAKHSFDRSLLNQLDQDGRNSGTPASSSPLHKNGSSNTFLAPPQQEVDGTLNRTSSLQSFDRQEVSTPTTVVQRPISPKSPRQTRSPRATPPSSSLTSYVSGSTTTTTTTTMTHLGVPNTVGNPGHSPRHIIGLQPANSSGNLRASPQPTPPSALSPRPPPTESPSPIYGGSPAGSRQNSFRTLKRQVSANSMLEMHSGDVQPQTQFSSPSDFGSLAELQSTSSGYFASILRRGMDGEPTALIFSFLIPKRQAALRATCHTFLDRFNSAVRGGYVHCAGCRKFVVDITQQTTGDDNDEPINWAPVALISHKQRLKRAVTLFVSPGAQPRMPLPIGCKDETGSDNGRNDSFDLKKEGDSGGKKKKKKNDDDSNDDGDAFSDTCENPFGMLVDAPQGSDDDIEEEVFSDEDEEYFAVDEAIEGVFPDNVLCDKPYTQSVILGDFSNVEDIGEGFLVGMQHLKSVSFHFPTAASTAEATAECYASGSCFVEKRQFEVLDSFGRNCFSQCLKLRSMVFPLGAMPNLRFIGTGFLSKNPKLQTIEFDGASGCVEETTASLSGSTMLKPTPLRCVGANFCAKNKSLHSVWFNVKFSCLATVDTNFLAENPSLREVSFEPQTMPKLQRLGRNFIAAPRKARNDDDNTSSPDDSDGGLQVLRLPLHMGRGGYGFERGFLSGQKLLHKMLEKAAPEFLDHTDELKRLASLSSNGSNVSISRTDVKHQCKAPSAPPPASGPSPNNKRHQQQALTENSEGNNSFASLTSVATLGSNSKQANKYYSNVSAFDLFDIETLITAGDPTTLCEDGDTMSLPVFHRLMGSAEETFSDLLEGLESNCPRHSKILRAIYESRKIVFREDDDEDEGKEVDGTNDGGIDDSSPLGRIESEGGGSSGTEVTLKSHTSMSSFVSDSGGGSSCDGGEGRPKKRKKKKRILVKRGGRK